MLGLEDASSWLVFVAYITLFVNNSLLVTATKSKNNDYNYNTILVVLLIEFLKLIVSIVMSLWNNSIKDLVKDLKSNKTAFVYYLVPSGLYCIFNNLVFLSLVQYDPTTYMILLQFSIVITGLIYQCIFQKELSWIQWVSLFVLTFGCILAHLNKDSKVIQFKMSNIFILVQVLCSSFAGVYNEYLLKNYSSTMQFWQQNIVMYTNSCICGIIMLMVTGNLKLDLLSLASFHSLYKPVVIGLICNNVTGGLVTSIFLHKLNSIVKKFAAAIELVILAVIGHVFTGNYINLTGAAAIFIVSCAVVVYTKYPLQMKTNVVKTEPTNGLLK